MSLRQLRSMPEIVSQPMAARSAPRPLTDHERRALDLTKTITMISSIGGSRLLPEFCLRDALSSNGTFIKPQELGWLSSLEFLLCEIDGQALPSIEDRLEAQIRRAYLQREPQCASSVLMGMINRSTREICIRIQPAPREKFTRLLLGALNKH
jgi:hypothetical protein